MTAQPHLSAFLEGSIPTVVALIGDEGCGKHSFCKALATKLDILVEDVSAQITEDFVQSLYECPTRKLYAVDSTKVVEKGQNALLKLLEEPPVGSSIVLLAESRAGLIDTLASRCFKLYFHPYSTQQLQPFVIG